MNAEQPHWCGKCTMCLNTIKWYEEVSGYQPVYHVKKDCDD